VGSKVIGDSMSSPDNSTEKNSAGFCRSVFQSTLAFLVVLYVILL
jgi:hypothetical protein